MKVCIPGMQVCIQICMDRAEPVNPVASKGLMAQLFYRSHGAGRPALHRPSGFLPTFFDFACAPMPVGRPETPDFI